MLSDEGIQLNLADKHSRLMAYIICVIAPTDVNLNAPQFLSPGQTCCIYAFLVKSRLSETGETGQAVQTDKC